MDHYEQGGGTVVVLLNDGHGGLGPFELYSTAREGDYSEPIPEHITVHDVDGDEDLDLIVGHWGVLGFSVLTNRGDGTFDTGVVYATALHESLPGSDKFAWTRPRMAQAGDFNGDGRLDVLNVATYRTAVVWSYQDPAQWVEVAVEDHFPEEAPDNSQFRIADFNLDGLPDLIVNSEECDYDHRIPCRVLAYLGTRAATFRRGDANHDNEVDLADAVAILEHLFRGRTVPGLGECLDRADTDDTGAVDLSDAVGLLLHLFQGGPAPAIPFEERGRDPTVDAFFCYPAN